MKTAVIYARYSSDKQSEQSIEGQLYDCYNYAKQHGIKVLREYIDRAMTGKNDDRPAFKEMIADSAKERWDYVLVWKLDRFARNTMDSAINRRELKKNGVRLLSIMESFGENASGEMMEHFIEAINEYYSAICARKPYAVCGSPRLKLKARGIFLSATSPLIKSSLLMRTRGSYPKRFSKCTRRGRNLPTLPRCLTKKGTARVPGKSLPSTAFIQC